MTATAAGRYAIIIIFLAALFSVAYNAAIPLHGDEAYYWWWSHHLQGGYYDHPPMIALLIALGNFISEAEWGVRLVNVVGLSAAAWVIYTLASEIADPEAGLWGVVIFESVILVHAGMTIVTPDTPLILFWSLALLAVYRVLTRGRTIDFVFGGLFIGAMMLSKYTSVLFLAALLLFLAVRRRDLFKDPRTYLAMGIALFTVAPLLWWNYRHDWISFLFQLHHGDPTETIAWNFFSEYIGVQFALFSPVFAAILFYALVKERLYFRRDALFFLALMTALPLLFFLYKSLHLHIELNYVAPAYIGGTVITAVFMRERRMKRTFYAGIAVALFFSLAARAALLWWLPVVQDRMYGNKEAVAMLNAHRKPTDELYANHLTLAALVSFYSPDHPAARIPTRTRFSQYDMWEAGAPFGEGLYLSYEPMEGALERRFESVTLIDTLEVQRGRDGTKSFYLYRVASER